MLLLGFASIFLLLEEANTSINTRKIEYVLYKNSP